MKGSLVAPCDSRSESRPHGASEGMGDTRATADCEAVLVPRALLRTLLEAADLLAEHWFAVAAATPVVCGADMVDQMVEIGLLDADDLEVREEFRKALHAGGVLLARSDSRSESRPDRATDLPAAGTFGD